jgi:hypothetical protein
MVRNVHSTKPPRAVGAKKQHLKLSLASADNPDIVIEAVGFNLGHLLADVRKWRNIDVTFTLTLNTWRERGWQPRTELNMHLRAIRPTTKGEDTTETRADLRVEDSYFGVDIPRNGSVA